MDIINVDVSKNIEIERLYRWISQDPNDKKLLKKEYEKLAGIRYYPKRKEYRTVKAHYEMVSRSHNVYQLRTYKYERDFTIEIYHLDLRGIPRHYKTVRVDNKKVFFITLDNVMGYLYDSDRY